MKQITISVVNETSGEEISTPLAAAKAIREVITTNQKEHFVVLLLNTRNKITHAELVSMGTMNESLVHPREVFRAAVIHGASRIIIGHNHPTGETSPSREDIDTTKRLKEAGKILGIELIDHVIVTEENFKSLREDGYL